MTARPDKQTSTSSSQPTVELDLFDDDTLAAFAPSDADLAAELTARRVEALAHLAPLHDLDRDKNMGRAGRDWDLYDTRLLAVTAIDTVVTNTGLHAAAGTPRDLVIDTVTRQAELCAPQRPHAEHVDVARWTLDRLLNVNAASRGHQIQHVDVLDGHHHTELDVRLLYELPDAEHDVVVCADTTAINLLVVALDHDIADAQIAAEAMLEAQLKSRRLGPAVRSAQMALQASKGYSAAIRHAIRNAQQDIRQISWVDQVEPQLDEALDHVESRVEFEKTLREHASTVSFDADADPAVARSAHRIVELLDEAILTLSTLAQHVLQARTVFRDEQNRQAFAAPAPVTLRDPSRDVLEPFAQLTGDRAAAVADQLLAAFIDHQQPLLLTFGPLVDTLAAQPRPAPDPKPDTDDDLVDLDPAFARFDQTTWERSDELLASVTGPTRMSALLADLDSADGRDVAVLTALRCLRVYTTEPATPRDNNLVATDTGTDLDNPWLVGPDLIVAPNRQQQVPS